MLITIVLLLMFVGFGLGVMFSEGDGDGKLFVTLLLVCQTVAVGMLLGLS